MRARSLRFAFLGALLFVSPGIASAQKLDKDDRAFLDGVRPILLADEEKLFKSLKEKADRLEFQKIFWARRDPDLATTTNEYQAEYEKARAEADRLYRIPAQLGSLTDCGRVYILLGKPDDVQQERGNVGPGQRAPETWTYKDKGTRTYAGGKAAIAFDEECRAAATLGPQMDARRGVVRGAAEPRVQEGQGRPARQARRAPAEGLARARAAQAAAAGVRDRGAAVVPQGGGRRHGVARPAARRGGGTERRRQLRRQDRHGLGRGERRGRGRQGVGLDRADDDGAGRGRRRVPGRVQARAAAGQVHAQGRRGRHQGRQGLARLDPDRGAGLLEGRIGRGRLRQQAALGGLADHRQAHRRAAGRRLRSQASAGRVRARPAAPRPRLRRRRSSGSSRSSSSTRSTT